jgi:lysozyme family protein
MELTPALAAEYQSWIDNFTETKHALTADRARAILPLIPHYKNVSALTGVPPVWLAAVMERESSSQLNTYLGNGDPLTRPTTDVPRGRGPFPTWDAGAIDALHLDGMDKVRYLPGGWRPVQALYRWELWNGIGYRMHGRRTPYIVGGTNLQQSGRYAGDGNWTLQWDTQLGCLPLAAELIKLDPSLDLTPSLLVGVTTRTVPPAGQPPAGTEPGSILWFQQQWNAKCHPEVPLVEDAVYGLQTARALRQFQTDHPPLVVDGQLGPATVQAMQSL